MNAPRPETNAPATQTGTALPPFGGLGFDLCGLGQACAGIPLLPPAPREAARPATAPRP